MPNRIRELRNARDWRLEDLADKLGCGTSQVSDLERGNRQLTYHWMQRLARAFRIQPADLLLERDNSRSLAPEEAELVDLYAGASEEEREKLMILARTIVGPTRKRRAA